MREIIELARQHGEEPTDITERVRDIVGRVGIRDGLCAVYAQDATAAIMIQENGDASVPIDVLNFLHRPAACGCPPPLLYWPQRLAFRHNRGRKP